MTLRIGIITVGGDSPGSNAAIRGLGKAAPDAGLIGFLDGYAGLANDHWTELPPERFSGVLTSGGTMLGTTRELPTQMRGPNGIEDRTEDVLNNYRKHELSALVVLGGKSAQKGALELSKRGLNLITLPLTIANDLPGTDTTIGFDTAMTVAAEAIDRLHSTAYSHHRIILVEVMGRETGWLTLGAGMAGGADVILIPEIAYEEGLVVEAIEQRSQAGKRFSIIAVAEGAVSREYRTFFERAHVRNERLRKGEKRAEVSARLVDIENRETGNTIHLANQLERRTGLETRTTILGYLQRGGTPSPKDRVLATLLGSAAAKYVRDGQFGVMVGTLNGQVQPVPLQEAASGRKLVPVDHPWIHATRSVGTHLGDEAPGNSRLRS